MTAQLDAQISGMQNLNAGEASALRLLSRATGSALRLAGSNDPAAGFASDFLGGLMQDGLASRGAQGGGAGAGAGTAPAIFAEASHPRGSQYQLNVGDEGLGLRPGSGQGMRWSGLRSSAPLDYPDASARRPVYDFDPDGQWDPDALTPINEVNRLIAQWVPPVYPSAIGAGIAGGGYPITRPTGAVGPPGYNPLYDLPGGAPGYRPPDPGLGIRVPALENVPPSGISPLILGPVMLGASWAQYLVDKRASNILADNLEAAGIVRPANTDAHHIVPYGDPRGAEIRRLLERFDIDINSAENGVFLPNKTNSDAPGSYHPRLNNRDYYDQLREDFKNSQSRQDALDLLQRIRDRLLDVSYPGSRPRPEK